ncbi:hypothetical protein BKA69DRAFT_1039411 [Paraphysoderma sedebokerense]|nr:hypothetical protein BKA69DRAFT_1039411 [Paraphysoderma sedebokerense]
MTKLAFTSLAVLFSAAVLGNSNVAANCACPDNNSFAINDQCYCGEDAVQIEKCVKSIAPNWPFAEEKPTGNDSGPCPNPVQDAAGFAACISKKVPQGLDNADQIASRCASRIKAVPKPAIGSANNTAPVIVNDGVAGTPAGNGKSRPGVIRNEGVAGIPDSVEVNFPKLRTETADAEEV